MPYKLFLYHSQYYINNIKQSVYHSLWNIVDFELTEITVPMYFIVIRKQEVEKRMYFIFKVPVSIYIKMLFLVNYPT